MDVPMPVLPTGYEFREGFGKMDFGRVTECLATTYWSPGIGRGKVERAAAGSSLVLGVFHVDDGQVGYARLVGDRTTFAWICDVFVAEGHRGKGIARAMIRFFQNHPDYREIRRFVLATRTAHGVYREVGFVQLPNAERWMSYMPGIDPPGC